MQLKITKRKYAFKAYASTYNLGILKSFNPDVQLKDTAPAIKSKLIELLTQLRSFEFVTTLVLVFERIESEDKTNYQKSLFKHKSRDSYQWKSHSWFVSINLY